MLNAVSVTNTTDCVLSLHCRDTLQKTDFHTYAVQSEIGKKTIRYRGSKLWNNLFDDLKSTRPTSLLSFKHRLKSYLLHTLEQ